MINQQVVYHKSAMPYCYPSKLANSIWLFDQGQTFAYSKTISKSKAQKSIAMWFNLNTFLELHNAKHTYTKLVCTQEQHGLFLLQEH